MKNNTTPSPNNISQIIIYTVCIFSVIFIFSFLLMANYYQQSITGMFEILTENLFIIHFNNVGKYPSSEINGHNIILYLYKFVIIAVISACIIFLFLINPSLKRAGATFKQITIIIWISSFFVFIVFQQVRRHTAISSEWAQFGPKTPDRKILSLHGMSYMFAKDVMEKLPEKIGVELESDIDIRKDPHQTYSRSLSYFLYPKISLRFDRGEPKKGILYFFKKSPVDSIPKDYGILSWDKERNYVLAVHHSIKKQK